MSNIFTTIWTDIESAFSSPVAQAFEEFAGFVAGGASAYALIEKVDPSNKAGTASDILAVSSAAYTVLTGATAPTIAQINAIFATFKSSTSTTNYDSIASTLATALYVFVQKYSSASWIAVGTAYIQGWQIAASALGGTTTTATATAPVATPAT